MKRLKYEAVELHTHTKNSDGSFERSELLKNAENFGYKAIFITDHNTNSAFDTYRQNKSSPIKAFKGFELTTFYGHILILGASSLYDFTKIKKDNLKTFIEKRRADDYIAVGLAHPFEEGSPFCTGCHYDFEDVSYEIYDYIELANGPNPQDNNANNLAYKLWEKKLLEGYKLAALAGRDWHGLEDMDTNFYVNMLGLESLDEKEAISAIKNSHTYISMEPILDFTIKAADKYLEFGDVTSDPSLDIEFSIKKGDFLNNKNFHIAPKSLRVINNDKKIFEGPITYESFVRDKIDVENGFVRFEILGDIKDKFTRLVVTSPIFIKEN
ncbi:CehA/McbA family metallohydrolase [Anaerococcus prevotii]|uniref:CehA/McbA family metallohydrolase n=1 Tax=Anaerococcus prevotii TaxID=33034 RepID=UPI0028060AF8|nr:CehA/McbA family metallohydrolase [Anaerococcus prevotii]MDU2557947.1 CehA/McbA family metallohydrolase [Anaerococcus prevotii]MDU3136956.1 CehA/McbA family metallohydrolase [Anaerococcus prevotii]